MNSTSAIASSMLMLAIQRTPFSTPETATATAAPIMLTTRMICTRLECGMLNRCDRPALRCSTPKPMSAPMPNTVATMPSASTV
ncbi:hypothetical protein G6F66_015072 [Rhizopus arrhizus]|nr:hypothetical protein G6F66_015072 [Rhizopus arrhizus]